MSAQDTSTLLLDAAQTLVQERGYNAFSYKDLESAVGIRTASIHYHFSSKADLGAALMLRYLERLEAGLEQIGAKGRTGWGALKAFIDMYRTAERAGAVCLCGSLASDQHTLPEKVQVPVTAYIERSEAWVEQTIHTAVNNGELGFAGKPTDAARTLVASLQGGLILSRAQGGPRAIDDIQRLFEGLLMPA